MGLQIGYGWKLQAYERLGSLSLRPTAYAHSLQRGVNYLELFERQIRRSKPSRAPLPSRLL